MKKSIISIALLSAVALMASCNEDRLEIEQKGVVGTETYYQTDEDAVSALNAAYAQFYYYVCTCKNTSTYTAYRACYNMPGDDVLAAGEFFGDNDFMGSLNEYRFDNSNAVITNCYKNLYYAVYYQNLVIDHFQNDTSAIKKKCVAEAKVLRAYLHMMLTIGWGNPPLVDHVLASDARPSNGLGQAEMFKWCAKECQEALPYLDKRNGKTDQKGAVKVTTGFANAIAGKSLLFAGDYANAKTALKAVMDEGNYDLVATANYEDNFHIEGDGNEEKIFEGNTVFNGDFFDFMLNRSSWMEANIWGWRNSHMVETSNVTAAYNGGMDGWGGLGIPQSFADELLAYDGVNSARLNTIMVRIDSLFYNTTYDNEVDGLTLAQKETSTKLGIKTNLYGQSFWLAKKQMPKPADCIMPGQNIRVNNYTLMRYAEVLLMYAECQAQLGDGDGSGLAALQKVNQRAGSATSVTACDMATVKKEKKFEMWFEGCRWADLVRWGDTEGVAQAGQAVPVLYDKLFRAPGAGDENVKWEYGTEANSRFYTVTTHEAKDRNMNIGFKTGKHEHFPYPFAEVSINGNLSQPGW